MKELEYKLLFNVQISETKLQIPSYENAILSFLKEVKRTSVKIKQVCDIQTKLNYFKNYCFSMGIGNLDTSDYLLLKYMQTGLDRKNWRDRLLGSQ